MQNLNVNQACICAVNASYTHSSLALLNLRAACAHLPITEKTYSINDSVEHACGALFELGCDVYLFGCYIWNLNFLESLAQRLKAVKPEAIVVFGGPEVSYDTETFMQEHAYVDLCLRGEGEESVPALLSGCDFDEIDGLCYRENNEIVVSGPACIGDLNKLPAVYDASVVESLANKLVYYETSRGCPFRCSYCLSSTAHGVRFFALERVLRDLKLFMDMGVPLVKLTDRTFNIDVKRTAEILRFILANNKCTCFHFEVTADLLTEELLCIFENAPVGWFQLEIGVQTTNANTLDAIDRRTDWMKFSENVIRLRRAGNMHMHLDLIAGLPEEDYVSFEKSFNDVFALKPDMLQLGFLKLLKGTKIRKQKVEHAYVFTQEPPYEVLASKWLSYTEMCMLKRIEAVLELYYNSGSYKSALTYSMTKSKLSPFRYFEALALFRKENADGGANYSLKERYALLRSFHTQCVSGGQDALFDTLLAYELLKNNKTASLDGFIALPKADKTFYTRAWEQVYANGCLSENLLAYSRKDVLKYVRIIRMEYNVLTYEKRDSITVLDYLNKKTYSLAVEDYEENDDG